MDVIFDSFSSTARKLSAADVFNMPSESIKEEIEVEYKLEKEDDR